MFGERATMTTPPPGYGATPPDRRRRTVFWAVVSILVLLTIMLLAVVFRLRGGNAPSSPDGEASPSEDRGKVGENAVASSPPAAVGSPHGRGDRGSPGRRAGGLASQNGEARDTAPAKLT
jgi:hypothetical protein